MQSSSARPPLQADAAVLSVCASIVLLVHLLTGNGYGFHRDEFQFLDDARHLQWGFTAYPPLTAFCGRLAIALFGISPESFRLPAALANMGSLVLTGLIARELGGRRAAQLLALFATLPLALAFSSVLQYNTFDLLAWTVMVFFTARLLRTGDERSWLGVGLGVGLGVLSKYSIAFPVVSLLAALLLLPSQRHHLRTRWFWYGALVATLLAAPNLLWLATHHFITLHMEHSIHARDVRLGRADGYYSDQLKFNLLALPLALAGLVSLLRNRRFRLLSAFFLGPFVLFALARGRGYYLLPAYPVLYAAGSVALERALGTRRKGARVTARAVVLTAALADCACVAWAYLPLWKPGSAAWNWQMHNNHDMADEVGWPEFVAQVAAVRDRLQADSLKASGLKIDGREASSQQRLGILANNYGEAGSLALYGPGHGLPTPISSTNGWYARGYGNPAPETVIVVGSNLQDQLLNFQQCTVAAQVHLPYGVQSEESQDHPQILVCRHLRKPWPEAWKTAQRFG